jgi:hypothetical protein
MKALTLPSGQDSVTVYTSDGSAEVMLLNRDVGGGGASVAFSKVFYVDKGTSVAPADQTGSAVAPFSTLLAGIAAMQAAQPNVDFTALILIPGDYSAEGGGAGVDCHHISLIGAVEGDSVSVRLPPIQWAAGAGLWLANVDALNGLDLQAGTDATTGASVSATYAQIGPVTNGGSLFTEHCTVASPFTGSQLVCRNSVLNAETITIQDGSEIELTATIFDTSAGSWSITFASALGTLIVDSLTAFSLHALSPALDLNSGQILVRADQGGAELTVTIPALANGVLGYAEVDTTGTELDGIDANDVVVGNPNDDLAGAGANGGAYIGCRVRTFNTIRCAFVGNLAGGGHGFKFARVTRVVPPPS